VVQDLTNERQALVTGANGFVGKALCVALRKHGWMVRRALRTAYADAGAFDDVVVSDIGLATDWRRAVSGIDTVIHLAARTHVMHDAVADPLIEYRHINVDGTQALAKAAESAGVRRFIFVSSIKVNGEATSMRPYTEHDAPRPEDAYGISKLESEQALKAAATRMQTVVLRPPLLYGPGVKGNFLRLMRAIERGVPLPLASVRNRRCLLYVENLIDAIVLCLDHPAAAGQTYLLSDDNEGTSTPTLVRAIALAMNKPARLLPFPPTLLKMAAVTINKSAAAARLVGSLQIDSGKIRCDLEWHPRYTLAEGLCLTAEWYYRRKTAPI
jgi:nucleoside-diphosphate-sugar epimerase